MISKTLSTGAGSDLVISMLKKLNWFCFTSHITLVLSVTYPEIFWGDQFQQRVWVGGGSDALLWFLGKALVGTRLQSSQKLQGFSTLKSLTFDENIPSTTCDETNSTIFFSKILP